MMANEKNLENLVTHRFQSLAVIRHFYLVEGWTDIQTYISTSCAKIMITYLAKSWWVKNRHLILIAKRQPTCRCSNEKLKFSHNQNSNLITNFSSFAPKAAVDTGLAECWGKIVWEIGRELIFLIDKMGLITCNLNGLFVLLFLTSVMGVPYQQLSQPEKLTLPPLPQCWEANYNHEFVDMWDTYVPETPVNDDEGKYFKFSHFMNTQIAENSWNFSDGFKNIWVIFHGYGSCMVKPSSDLWSVKNTWKNRKKRASCTFN